MNGKVHTFPMPPPLPNGTRVVVNEQDPADWLLRRYAVRISMAVFQIQGGLDFLCAEHILPQLPQDVVVALEQWMHEVEHMVVDIVSRGAAADSEE